MVRVFKLLVVVALFALTTELFHGLKINRDSLQSGVDVDFVDPSETKVLEGLKSSSSVILQNALKILQNLQQNHCRYDCTSDRFNREETAITAGSKRMWLKTSFVVHSMAWNIYSQISFHH